MGTTCLSFNAHVSMRRPLVLPFIDHLSASICSAVKPFLKELQDVQLRINVNKSIKNASLRLLDAFVDSTIQFIDHPTLPSQRNFAPVEEIGEAVVVTNIEGEIPADFPDGVYIRNGSNPMFGALQSAVSPFGTSSHIWVEGEGMLHAVYFTRDLASGSPAVSYQNRYVESDTFHLERRRNRPCFLPAVDGDSTAVIAAYILNVLRFGKVNKYISNTNVFEHAGKLYSVAENHIPQEIDIDSLYTIGNWDVNGSWDRPFTAHPKKAPGTRELVITGVEAKKPFVVLGVISADGERLVHKVDLKFERSSLCHDIGVTKRYNVIMDIPLTIDINRLIRGGPLIKFERESYAKIGVIPRYGDADSIKWFSVEPHCTFHLINCYEEADEVVVRGCRALESVIPKPDLQRGLTDASIKDENLLSRLYEWRLNMKTGEVKERYLRGKDFCIDFPMINDKFNGLHHKFAYAQVADPVAVSSCGLPKYGSLAKLCFTEEQGQRNCQVEHHSLGENQFCSGAAFVAKPGGSKEDDGWVVAYVHKEETDVSQVHIIDAKKFESGPVTKITLPQRVPYGFHGAFIRK